MSDAHSAGELPAEFEIPKNQVTRTEGLFEALREGVDLGSDDYSSLDLVWPNGIIFHQPSFP